jgi:hypothetical protein
LALVACAGDTPSCTIATRPDPVRANAPHAPAPAVVAAAFCPGDPCAAARAETVVLVAIDGVRWREVFEGVDRERALAAGLADAAALGPDGLMPNLHWLMRARGCALGAPGVGEPISASGPHYVSLPGYLEMLTGRREVACASNDCPRTRWRTVADDFGADAAVVSSWPSVARAAAASDLPLVSAGRGEVRGELGALMPRWLEDQRVDPAPGYNDYRPDTRTGPLALQLLRERHPRFLFVSLGDSDEYGHKNDYRGYLRALVHADRVVGEIATALAERSAAGHATLLLVTADHGRSKSFADHGGHAPESARVWLVAAGDSVRARGYVPSPVPRYLADVAATIRKSAGLPPSPDQQGVVLDELFAPSPGAIAGL